jgi:hypothetical protein
MVPSSKIVQTGYGYKSETAILFELQGGGEGRLALWKIHKGERWGNLPVNTIPQYGEVNSISRSVGEMPLKDADWHCSVTISSSKFEETNSRESQPTT